MTHSLQVYLRSMALCLVVAFAALWAQAVSAQDAPAPQEAPTVIRTVQVQGNQRVEANTVASYLLFLSLIHI